LGEQEGKPKDAPIQSRKNNNERERDPAGAKNCPLPGKEKKLIWRLKQRYPF